MVTKAVTGQLTIFECIFSIGATRNRTQVSKETGKVPAESFIDVSEKIKVYGSAALKEKTMRAVRDLPLTGIEPKDRLLIQNLLDQNSKMAGILYDGNIVYPYEKLKKELIRMKKTNSIRRMSKLMYEFLSLHFDIAHYSREGFIDYYDGEYSSLYNETLSYVRKRIPARFSDINKIAEEM